MIGVDIEKMHHQVWIEQYQIDLQRIVWRADTNEELQHYKLNIITYGTTPAKI